MQSKTTHRNVERRQRAKRFDAVRLESDFFVRFAKRRLLIGFASIDHAARQRDLSAVASQTLGANRQDDIRARPVRDQQDQSRRGARVSGIEARGLGARLDWGHQRLSNRTWQRCAE